MAFDLIPSALWNLPLRPSIMDDDDWLATTAPSGVSVSEDESRIYVTAAFPGVPEDKIDITFDKGMLWLKGEAEDTEEDKKRKFYRKAASSFSYRVAVPGDLDLSIEPEAAYKHGVMTVIFTKSPQSQPKKISVKSKSK